MEKLMFSNGFGSSYHHINTIKSIIVALWTCPQTTHPVHDRVNINITTPLQLKHTQGAYRDYPSVKFSLVCLMTWLHSSTVSWSGFVTSFRKTGNDVGKHPGWDTSSALGFVKMNECWRCSWRSVAPKQAIELKRKY